MENQIALIVGLGNPGPEYLVTRHNAGFWFADLLAQAHGGNFRREKKLHGDACEITIAGHRIRLLKPQTFMNESGRAVAAATTFYKIPAEQVLVAYDELDLPPGRAKLKFAGGDAGHNGLGSVIAHLGASFWRLRLGIGHPGPGQRNAVVRYVLERASPEDEQAILDAVRASVEVLPVLLEQGEQRAKTLLHSHGGAAHDETQED